MNSRGLFFAAVLISDFGCSTHNHQGSLPSETQIPVKQPFEHPGCSKGDPLSFILQAAPLAAERPSMLEAPGADFIPASQNQNFRFDVCAETSLIPATIELAQVIKVSGQDFADPTRMQATTIRIHDGLEVSGLGQVVFGEVPPDFKIWQPGIAELPRGFVALSQGNLLYVADQATLRDKKYRAQTWVVGTLVDGDLQFGVARCKNSESLSRHRWSVGQAEIEAELCIRLSVGEGTWSARPLRVVLKDSNPLLPKELRGEKVWLDKEAEQIYTAGAGHHGCHPLERLTVAAAVYLNVQDWQRGTQHFFVQYTGSEIQHKTSPMSLGMGAACDGFSMPPLRVEAVK